MSFSDGLITGLADATSTDLITAPGFVDIQINGGWAHDFTADPSSIWDVGQRLPATGVTTFLPTIVTAPYSVADAAIQVLIDGPPVGYLGADPIGLHIEGPWISPEWNGAHNPQHLREPDPAVAARWAESGVVRMVTIAPELPGADKVASILSNAGVVVSAGHSGADFETGVSALRGPWKSVTHLFNQMTPLRHREPGMVGAALLSGRPCGLIADGLHSHPGAVELAWSLLGPQRLILITDAMAATGLDDGSFVLGDLEVTVGHDGPRNESGMLAGSTLTMDRAVANLVSWTSATIEQAIISASYSPATLIGSVDRGRLSTGQRADVVVLDRELRVVETVVGGEVVYRSEGP
jgi:N-acetylglucosamine-6-phosphate deacetylase